MIPPTIRRAAIYARVSTAEQNCDNQTIELKVENWIDKGRGLASAYGFSDPINPLTSGYEIHISDNGRLDASIKYANESFIVSDVGDHVYYVVMQIEQRMGAID